MAVQRSSMPWAARGTSSPTRRRASYAADVNLDFASILRFYYKFLIMFPTILITCFVNLIRISGRRVLGFYYDFAKVLIGF